MEGVRAVGVGIIHCVNPLVWSLLQTDDSLSDGFLPMIVMQSSATDVDSLSSIPALNKPSVLIPQ